MKGYAHSREELPEGYTLSMTVDLLQNRKQMLMVNGLALAIALIMVLVGLGICPIAGLFSLKEGLRAYCLRFAVLAAGSVVYIFAHEWVHGVAMRYYSPIKPTFGFSGMYAYAGSTAYFDRSSYLVIAMAPVVIWGAVLMVLHLIVPESWFWVVYIIQISNISGAAGDFYVTVRFMRMKEILVQDSGTSMRVYERR